MGKEKHFGELRFSRSALGLETMAAFRMLSQLFLKEKKKKKIYSINGGEMGEEESDCIIAAFRSQVASWQTPAEWLVSLRSSDVYTASALFVIDPMPCCKLSTALKCQIGLVWSKVKAEVKEEAFSFFFLPIFLTRPLCQFEELNSHIYNTGGGPLFSPLP